MPSWADLLGKGSVAEQLLVWGVLNQLLGDLLGPMELLVQQRINAAHPEMVLSPGDLADGWVRNFIDQADAEGEAAKSGVNADRFAVLRHLAGEAPAPFQLAEALRRKIITADGKGPESTSFAQGIAEGRLGNKWGPIIEALAVQWPTPNDALEALLEGQIDEGTAHELYQRFGGDPEFFQMLFDTRGNAPTPMEALEMLRRGIIVEKGTGPESTSYDQAFLEGPWRNKWLGPFKALAEYIPPPRSIPALLRTGSITEAEAVRFLMDAGLSKDLAAAFIHNAKGEKMAGTHRLAEGTVVTLYESQAIDRPAALAHLIALGYDQADAELILELTDLQRELRLVNSAITRLGALYVARKITRTAAGDGLKALDVTADHAAHLLGSWDIERSATVRQLTPAQIESAWFYDVITEDEALAELHALGYTPFDAWVALSVRGKTPLAGKPAQGPGGPGLLP